MAAGLVCLVVHGSRTLLAAPASARPQGQSPSWHAVETANFRVLNFGNQAVSPETAEACESLREKLAGQWLGDKDPVAWTPKCDIVLHSTDEGYSREVGSGGRDTVASSLINRKQGRIATRRIDIRATHADWQTRALGHELTHVILADRFVERALPRWVDEGMAILADPADKQGEHLRDLKHALATRDEFRVPELITLADYPQAHRWGAFYGQSASLVKFLVNQGGHERFVRFVELALERGYEKGLRQIYDFGVADLERRWHAELAAQARPRGAAPSTVVRPTSPHAAPLAVLPVSLGPLPVARPAR